MRGGEEVHFGSGCMVVVVVVMVMDMDMDIMAFFRRNFGRLKKFSRLNVSDEGEGREKKEKNSMKLPLT